jgi:hypothetical protein
MRVLPRGAELLSRVRYAEDESPFCLGCKYRKYILRVDLSIQDPSKD